MTALEQLPTRIDALESQISQLREEMHAEFSAVRNEISAGNDETRRSLREEMREQASTLRREARIYHEDVIGRLKLLYEGRDPSVGPPPAIETP